MSSGTPASLISLPLETGFNIFGQGLSIKNLRDLRETSKDLRLKVDEFVKNLLIRSNTQGPFILKNFLATQKEPITSTNAWSILGLFKKAYPSFPLDVSIEKGCQQLDQATMALKEALVLQNPQQFDNLALQQTAEEIRNWFNNPINHPLLQTVTQLNLSGRGIFLIPEELRFFPNLQKLFLYHNQIKAIHREAFSNLQNLKWLDLSNNQIKAIPTNAFSNLLNLVLLHLRLNQITSINRGTFLNLSALSDLRLGENTISSIDHKAFSNLLKLKSLDLSGNNIRAIDPMTFAKLQKLEELDLSRNNIRAIDPQTFANLQKLEKLNLSRNNIRAIAPQTFSKLRNLKRPYLNNY